MSSTRFLPYVRRGLAAGAADPLRDNLPGNVALRATVELSDSNGVTASSTHDAKVAGPGDVSGIDVAQVVRLEPPEGTNDFETNYLPFVELISPDLPWLLTPASPTGEGALRPWLVLVVVEESDGVGYADTSTGGILTIDADHVASQLWDLADSHVWAHAQSTAPDTASAVDQGTGQVISRLMCPRKLQVGTRYRAALVPAFDAGAAAGLGEPVAPGDLHPAWDLDDPADTRLPTYVSWTFSTSDEPGDFESLAIRLQPDLDGGRLGFRRTRLDIDGILPSPDDRFDVERDLDFEFAGALVDPGASAKPLPRRVAAWVEAELRTALERGRGRVDLEPIANYRPERDDPVLAPPMYGQWAAGVHRVPKEGWVAETNLDVAQRAAAGLGAEIVRQSEHEFLASAWDQVGSLREAKVEVNRTRLVAEVADRQLDRLSMLDDATLIFAAGRIAANVPVDGGGASSQTVEGAVRASKTVPPAVVSSAFYRAARSGAVVESSYRSGPERALARRVANRFVTAAGGARPAGTDRRVTAFKQPVVPDGAIIDIAAPGPAVANGDSAADAATALRTLRPSVVAFDRLAARVDGLAPLQPATKGVGTASPRAAGTDLMPASGGTVRLIAGPWFPDGLSPKLQALSAEFLLPGVGQFGRDRVRLLEINEAFTAALLVGANHEWAREALWREFPADMEATAFASLFDRPGDPPAPGPETDLNTELAAADRRLGLADLVGGSGTGTVLLMRAELVRRFPGLSVSLLRPVKGGVPLAADGSLMADHVTAPMFRGQIDASTIFVGFDEDPSTVLDKEWFISVEEPPSGPRFGFDVGSTDDKGGRDAGPQQPPSSWSDLTWAHMRAADPDATHLRLSTLEWDGIERPGAEWARNGAHQARIAFQQPFRMIFPASALLGGQT